MCAYSLAAQPPHDRTPGSQLLCCVPERPSRGSTACTRGPLILQPRQGSQPARQESKPETFNRTLPQTVWRLQGIFGVQLLFARNEAARGYGAANAQAVHMSTGKYIALVNSDA